MNILKVLSNFWGGMTTTQKVAIISIVVSVVTSILTTLLTSWLASRRGRRDRVWEHDLKRVQRILDLAGKMYKEVRYNTSKEYKEETILPLLNEFEQNERFLLKYKNLDEAIFYFPAGVHYFIDEKVTPEEEKEFADLYDKLCKACKLVLKGKGK
ncbi:MAG: hypothetical protein ABII93_06085 [Chrysiogenia bacterium]